MVAHWCLRLKELKIETSSSVLVAIKDVDIDLGTVESTISRFNFPLSGSSETIQSLSQSLLGLLPGVQLSQKLDKSEQANKLQYLLLRSSGEIQLQSKAKLFVDKIQKFQRSINFGLDLVLAAEDMTIVLAKPTDTSKASQGTGQLITMKDTEISVAKRKVLVGAGLVAIHQTVARTVHGLQSESSILHLKLEHVVFVVGLVCERELQKKRLPSVHWSPTSSC
jgi:hypothetical protein